VALRVLVTGGSGLLGSDLLPILSGVAHEVIAPLEDELDITDFGSVKRAFDSLKPEAVVHCAAYTNVDGAEKNSELAKEVNFWGTDNIAKVASNFSARMVHLSTDYVFSGNQKKPLEETAPCGPISVYGMTKYQAELAVKETHNDYVILRISWLFGAHGKCFPKTILKLASERSSIEVVSDQFGRPTFTKDVSRTILSLLGENSSFRGILHCQNNGPIVSWCQLAQEILREANVPAKVVPVTTEEWLAKYPQAAPRPRFSGFDLGLLNQLGIPMRPWKEALRELVGDILKEEKT